MIKAFESNSNIVDVKAVGTSMRFLTAYLSQCPGEKIITGIERMKNRPIHMLVDALNLLGADIKYAEKRIPTAPYQRKTVGWWRNIFSRKH